MRSISDCWLGGLQGHAAGRQESDVGELAQGQWHQSLGQVDSIVEVALAGFLVTLVVLARNSDEGNAAYRASGAKGLDEGVSDVRTKFSRADEGEGHVLFALVTWDDLGRPQTSKR